MGTSGDILDSTNLQFLLSGIATGDYVGAVASVPRVGWVRWRARSQIEKPESNMGTDINGAARLRPDGRVDTCSATCSRVAR